MAEFDAVTVGDQVRNAREDAGITAEEASRAIGVTEEEYASIEAGQRPLKGDELVLLADRFGIRAATITVPQRVRERVRSTVVRREEAVPFAEMRDHLHAYFELDGYLRDHGISQV